MVFYFILIRLDYKVYSDQIFSVKLTIFGQFGLQIGFPRAERNPRGKPHYESETGIL